MSTDVQGTKWHRNIVENFNRLSTAHERYRQTTDGRAIAYSEREREFAKKRDKSRVGLRRDYPRCCSAMWICMCDHSHDVVIPSFIKIRSGVLEPQGGSNLAIPVTLAVGFYNSLYYCTSCGRPNIVFMVAICLICQHYP